MPLPLLARKSLRDNEEHLKTAVESIQQSLGVEWSIEFDFETISAKLDESYRTQLGDLFYKDVAGYIAQCVKRACENEMTKEALIEANTSNKISVVVNDDKKFDRYWKFVFQNNTDLVLFFKPNLCNLSDIAYLSLSEIIPTPGVYSLNARLNLKKNEESFQESFEKIKEITKVDWSLDDTSLETLYPTLEKSYQDSIGDIFSEITIYVAQNIVKRCADEMVLEAFNEVCTNGKLVFKNNAKQSEYWTWAFINGDLVVSYRSICNTSDNAHYNFEKLL
ncbi:hypothetical protein DICPUDRAFT_54731 [Dictyostelium purpureum]|uniref:Uncharacterized protein n=1 Tax=Dictyostelium purpureum TaxID=5786 RepID=F0ZIG9_DICPU|nr:uncharacterized protein DICPUDRAFT_54731 [Dictyostelium purpureum]EGC36259.1 hypothetical protein DICPUDRAFT_54731 [Dictyostelium purpureum]|eukprot:XP_003287205.1 hypothetical protein DICPUDRAFT_54731 [Dictyostelium purpureum]